MSRPYVLPLDSPDASFELAGGKAANLARLLLAGFPVPGGFILTTRAYDDYVAANDLAGFILATAGAAPASDPAVLEAASTAIRMRFAQGHLPPEVAGPLRSAYGALELSSVAVAVRSSATAEDLPDLSFAGQQDTFLNIVGEEALLHAVVNCWSSLWTARAIGYRARNNISHGHIALAVLVQAMVQSEASGVLFTANPLTGKRAENVIEATLGLGEALVFGKIEPDHYVLDAKGAILRKTLGTKALAIQGKAGGAETAADGAARYQALPDVAIAELAGLGWRAAELFGWPQDIEWAWANDHLWLLQSRPITSLYPLPEGMPPDPLQVLISFGAVQGILEPLTPLGQDAVCALLAGAANLFGGKNRVTYATQRVAVSAGERLFLNITGLFRHGATRSVARAVPAFVEPTIGQAMSSVWDDSRLAPTTGRIRLQTLWRLAPVLLPVVGRFVATFIRPDARREHAQRYLEEAVGRAQTRAVTATTLPDRLALLDEALALLPRALFTRWLPAFAPGMAMLNLLLWLGKDIPGGRQLVLQATRGLSHNVTTEMDLALWDVARKIGGDPVARACLENVKVSTLAADALAGRLPPTAQAALDGFLSPFGAHNGPGYGMRGVGEIDMGRPRWSEDPTPVIQAVRSYLRIEDPEQAPDAVFARGTASAQAAIQRLCRDLRAQRGGWIKVRLARWAARRVRALVGLRESPKFAIVRVLGILRESFLAMGQELAAAGTISQAGDIFFVTLGQLEGLARGGEGVPAARLRETVALRRERYAREMLRRQIPRLMLSDGQAFYEGMAVPEGVGDGLLVGSPVSPGVAEGAVRVVLDPRGATLAPGEILVCPGTDPAWTPLFLVAGGLVTEVGGLMTHGAVVAREYGIPAVVGVTGATSRLKTGQRVRVDGASGQVMVLPNATNPAAD